MLDDGIGFRLVPWRPVIEQRLGQGVNGLAKGTNVSWDLGRQLVQLLTLRAPSGFAAS